MGVAMGLGIIITLITQMIMLPAMIVWNSKGYSISAEFLRKCKLGILITLWHLITGPVVRFFKLPFFSCLLYPFRFGFLSGSGRFISKIPVAITVLLTAIVLIILSVKGGSRMQWEYDFMELQPKGTPSQITQKTILDKFEISPDSHGKARSWRNAGS
jgi:predicted RND superfamily exporter protein